MATTIISIGYEGRTPDEMISALLAQRVTRVLDVRALPLSRRRGFSKTALAARLERAGIEYRHVRSAGNPHRHLKADVERCLELYERHLRDHPEVVDLVVDEARGHRVALLCVEREHAACHRSRLLLALQRRRRARLRMKVVQIQ